MVGYCENCLNQHKEELCRKCADNPQIIPMVSYYTPYLEVCPIKEWGCNNDPGFIKYFFPFIEVVTIFSSLIYLSVPNSIN